jgi:hypothetical protein
MTRARDVANVLSTATALATDTETAAAISTHNSATTSVHGITNTATLATQTYADSSVSTHAAASDPHAGYVLESLIDAKGDLIVGSADNTVAKLSIGNSGDSIVADSAATVGLRYSATPSASNPVINSAFQVWQRGTSFSIPASAAATYTADRWQCSGTGANQALTISRQVTNDTTNLPSIQYALRFQRNSGQTATGGIYLLHSFETINSIPFVGKTVTLSFYARKGADYSPTSSALGVNLRTGTGSDQNVISYTGAASPISQNATLTTTWQRFTYSGSIATTATELGLRFDYNATGTASTNDYFEITGVQIDIGSVALPFRTQNSTLQGELAACQRYYYRITSGSAYGYLTGSSSTGGTNGVGVPLYLPVPMRTNPTVLEYSNIRIDDTYTSANAITTATIQSNQSTNQILIVNASWTGGTTVGRWYIISANNNTGAYIGAGAEL